MKKTSGNLQVMILVGSKNDEQFLPGAIEILKYFGVAHEAHVCSAHREPAKLSNFVKKAESSGCRIIIAGAGLAAHLPGVIASQTLIPVIGVPLVAGSLQGLDALLSIVQMPKGIPVATVGIGRMDNAALLAIQILASGGDAKLTAKLKDYRINWGRKK